MSGNQPQDNTVPPGTGFPTIGDYEWVPGPGDAGYVPPDEDVPIDSEPVDYDDGLDEDGNPVEEEDT